MAKVIQKNRRKRKKQETKKRKQNPWVCLVPTPKRNKGGE